MRRENVSSGTVSVILGVKSERFRRRLAYQTNGDRLDLQFGPRPVGRERRDRELAR